MNVHPTAALSVDPITVEVIGNAFSSIADEMGSTLVRASSSPNIKERKDCSTAIMDAQGLLLCQAEHVPMHLGSFIDFIPQLLRRYDLSDIRPGDVFIGNDPYVGGGTHLPDIVMVEPVYVGHRLVAWVINTAHHSDFADRGHQHIFQEGPRIPPLRYSRGEQVNREVLDFLLLNCQVPDERISDLSAQLAANRLGVRRIKAICDKYGADVMLVVGAELQNYSERRMRAAIRAMPDGVYRFTDRFDSCEISGELPISIELTIAGDSLHMKFDAPPQVRAGINMIYTALLATVYYAAKSVADPEVPPNAGLGRPITVEAPVGSIINCSFPAAVNGRTSLAQRVVDVILGAFAVALPRRIGAAAASSIIVVQFSGARADGSQWVYLESIGGGLGARADKPGMHGVQSHMTNTSNLPTESLEREYPLTLLEYSLVTGSGGKGRFAGGMGIRRVYRAERECRVEVDGSRITTLPWGAAGGAPGQGFTYSVNGAAFPFPGGLGTLRPGDIVEIVTPGGGGYGAA